MRISVKYEGNVHLLVLAFFYFIFVKYEGNAHLDILAFLYFVRRAVAAFKGM